MHPSLPHYLSQACHERQLYLMYKQEKNDASVRKKFDNKTFEDKKKCVELLSALRKKFMVIMNYCT